MGPASMERMALSEPQKLFQTASALFDAAPTMRDAFDTLVPADRIDEHGTVRCECGVHMVIAPNELRKCVNCKYWYANYGGQLYFTEAKAF